MRRLRRWRRSRVSRLAFVQIPIYGTTIVAAGLLRSQRLQRIGLLVETRRDWF